MKVNQDLKVCAVRYIGIILMVLLAACGRNEKTVSIKPWAATGSVRDEAGDCAIWIHPRDPALSAVIGNDRTELGGLYVWDLSGRELFKTQAMFKPGNVDVRYGMKVSGNCFDIVVCALSAERKLKVFKIDPETRHLIDITSFGGVDTFLSYECYGLCLYKNPSTQKIYAFVTSRETSSNIHQILLEDDGTGRIKGSLVRVFGGEKRKGLMDELCADDTLGYLYCSDEEYGVLKYHADPDAKEENFIGRFAVGDGIVGERKGISSYECPDGKGYLVLSSQGNSTLKLYERAGNNAFVKTVVKQGSLKTIGVDVTSCPAGSFKNGFVVCHNEDDENFILYDWNDIAGNDLLKCTCQKPY